MCQPKMPFAATAALCSCSLIHAFVLISVFPYAGYMVIDLIPTLSPETAGPYAGLLASSFMAGRALSSYPWGRAADLLGRKFVLITSLALSALFSLLFGLSKSFAMALLWRFLLGLSNGIMGTVKTVVSEIAEGDLEQIRIMGMVVGMRAWGFLISPAVGGWLSEPTKQYPRLFNASSQWYYRFLSKYPFLLPNLFGALVCISTALVVAFCIPETLPSDQLWRPTKRNRRQQSGEVASLLPHAATNGGYSAEHGSATSTDDENDAIVRKTNSTTMSSLWKSQSTKENLVSYWLFSLAVVSLDEAFPLFCIATKGGLGLSEGGIGKILSLAGLLFATCQYVVYIKTTDAFGLYQSLWIGCAFGFLPVLFIPMSRLVNPTTAEKDLDGPSSEEWPMVGLLTVLMALSKIFCCMFFTSMSIALNKTVDKSQRATLNGLATLGGSIAKGCGPVLAGCLVSVSFARIGATYGSVVIFTFIGCLGFGVLLTLSGSPTNP